MSNPSLDYLHAQSPAPPDHQPTWPRVQKPAVKYTRRFDSGVADVEAEDGEISLRQMPATVPYGPVSDYDYAARSSHFYEDLPVTKYAPAPEDSLTREKVGPEPHQQSSWPSTVSQVSTTNSQAAIVNNNNTEARKRQNPLYDAIHAKYPAPPGPDGSQESVNKVSSHRVLFICVFAVIALIVSLISLFIAIYILVTLPQDKFEEANKAHIARYDQLKAEFQDLSNKYSELSSMLSYHPSESNSSNVSLGTKVAINQIGIQGLMENISVQQEAVKNLQVKVTAIDDIEKTLVIYGGNISKNAQHINTSAVEITSLNHQVATLYEHITNVSKMEGPPGIGNLSACVYTNHSHILRNAIPDATTSNWYPSVPVLTDSVVMSASCSVIGGTVASLESRPEYSVPNALQYRCHCSGVDSKIPDRVCYLHLWKCPRLS